MSTGRRKKSWIWKREEGKNSPFSFHLDPTLSDGAAYLEGRSFLCSPLIQMPVSSINTFTDTPGAAQPL
jgi:hypothetical protein